jgi:hypothetical protein
MTPEEMLDIHRQVWDKWALPDEVFNHISERYQFEFEKPGLPCPAIVHHRDESRIEQGLPMVERLQTEDIRHAISTLLAREAGLLDPRGEWVADPGYIPPPSPPATWNGPTAWVCSILDDDGRTVIALAKTLTQAKALVDDYHHEGDDPTTGDPSDCAQALKWKKSLNDWFGDDRSGHRVYEISQFPLGERLHVGHSNVLHPDGSAS